MPVLSLSTGRRRTLALLTGAAAVGALALTSTTTAAPGSAEPLTRLLPHVLAERAFSTAGDAGDESHDAAAAGEQFAQARTAPGIVGPGAYTSAYNAITALKSNSAGGQWSEVTNTPYYADDPYFRDVSSNSGTGDVNVTGRITSIAADKAGYVYAAGADGGVWRAADGGGSWTLNPQDARTAKGNAWTPIADDLPSLSTGDLELDPATGSLWFGTGEANTGGTAYPGDGVFAVKDPKTEKFTLDSKVGGDELDSTTITKLRFSGTTVFAATNRGVWSHSTDLSSRTVAWKLQFAPNPAYLPVGSVHPRRTPVPARSQAVRPTRPTRTSSTMSPSTRRTRPM